MEKRLIILMGLPGTGKTRLGEVLEKKLSNSKHLRILTILRNIGLKRYSRKKAQMIEDLFFLTAKKMLNYTNTLILENVFSTSIFKQNVLSFAKDCKVETLLIELVTPEIVAKRRIRNRPRKDELVCDSRNPKHYDNSARRWENFQIDFQKYPCLSAMRFYNHDINSLSFIESIHIDSRIEQFHRQVLKIIVNEFQVRIVDGLYSDSEVMKEVVLMDN